MITQKQLEVLANKWEPEASQSEPGYRKATCVDCGRVMVEMWHCWLNQGGFKKEVHLCNQCGASYGLFLEHKTLVVIATNNGKKYLEQLLPTVKYNYVVIDTGSTEQESIDYFDSLSCAKARINGGYCVAAYEYAYRNIKAEEYFFMHDSMIVKKGDFIDDFRGKGEVVAWMHFDLAISHGIDYIKNIPGKLDNVPLFSIFGPIFYATRNAMETIDKKGLLPPHPTRRDEQVASETGYAISFHRAGLNLDNNFVERMCNQRIDETRDYILFDKFRPNRQ